MAWRPDPTRRLILRRLARRSLRPVRRNSRRLPTNRQDEKSLEIPISADVVVRRRAADFRRGERIVECASGLDGVKYRAGEIRRRSNTRDQFSYQRSGTW